MKLNVSHNTPLLTVFNTKVVTHSQALSSLSLLEVMQATTLQVMINWVGPGNEASYRINKGLDFWSGT